MQADGEYDDGSNTVRMLQRRHTKPLHSHETYLQEDIQPTYASEARGVNPWTGQSAEEVREAAFSEQQYQDQLKRVSQTARK